MSGATIEDGSSAVDGQGAPGSAALHFDEAPVNEPIPDDRVSRARDLVLAGNDLHYLAGYGVGFRSFDVDVLARVGADPERRRELCRRVGRKLSFQAARHLEEWLAPLESGPLIRTVIRTAEGAFYCHQVVPGQYLVGATLLADPAGQPSIAAADEALALCIAEIRAEILINTQDLGGWESERLRRQLEAADTASREAVAAAVAGSAEFRPHVAGAAQHPGVELCRAAVSPGSLHLIALFDDDGMSFSVDVLAHDGVTAALTSSISSTARRELYHRVGLALPAYLRELARTARDVIGGPMTSGVLDVEQGAIYFRRLDERRYLSAVTLHQARVTAAEGLLARVADEWPGT